MANPDPDQDFGHEFITRLGEVTDLSRPTKSKFADVFDYVERQLGVSVVVTYVSSLGQMWARIGTSIMSLPGAIVVLSPTTFSTTTREGSSYVESVEALVRYTTGLQVVIVCVGEEGHWQPEFVVGPTDSPVRKAVASALPMAEDRPVRPGKRPSVPPEAAKHKGLPSLSGLAGQLYLDTRWLDEVGWLLSDRKALVFYGPPGTGKTYIARRLASHLQPNERFRRVVQLHPSYGYEDFFEGFRPAEGEHGGISLVKRDGPLRALARAAEGNPEETLILLLDELNRGNLARIFGELYYLLEYRRDEIGLMYSPTERFSLPDNLILLGTMNTSDRSVATIDQALRRRFHFVPLFPTDEPVKGMLRQYLRDRNPQMTWLADLLDEANERLGDRNVAIGPSHFMRPDLDENTARLVWDHSVIPSIEEQFFGEGSRIEEFRFDVLRSSAEGDKSRGEG